MMKKSELFDFMDSVTDAVMAAAPFATMMGIPFIEKVAGWADTAVDVGKNVLERAEEMKVVLTSDDVVTINERITALEAVNAALNAEIAAS